MNEDQVSEEKVVAAWGQIQIRAVELSGPGCDFRMVQAGMLAMALSRLSIEYGNGDVARRLREIADDLDEMPMHAGMPAPPPGPPIDPFQLAMSGLRSVAEAKRAAMARRS